MNKSGYIYFASNPSMPGLLKVGATDEAPSERLPKLHTTGVPTPFVLEASIRVIDSHQAEKRVHELLAESRQSGNREFFQVSLGDAIARCFPHLTKYLTSSSNLPEGSPTLRLPPDEENVLRLIAKRMNHSRKPNKREVQCELKLSAMRAELVFGNLIKRRFVREITEERKHQTGENAYEFYKVKVLKIERAGIQYLLDNRLMTPEEL